MSDDAEEPEELPPDKPGRRHVDWKKARIGGGASLTALGLFAGACVGLRMARWAVCDGTWLCSPRTKVTTVVSAAPPITVAPTPTTIPRGPVTTMAAGESSSAPQPANDVEAPSTTIAPRALTGGWCDPVYRAYNAGRSITSNERKGCGL